MGFALQFLWSFVAAAHSAGGTTDRAAACGAAGPPFVLVWRAEAGGAHVLEVVPRWAERGAIALTRSDDGVRASDATEVSRRTFGPRAGAGNAPLRPVHITATWREPSGTAGAFATAVWPEPVSAPAPDIAPMPSIRIHDMTLDHAVRLP